MQQKLYNQPDAENINFTVKYQDKPSVLSDVCLFSSFSFTGIVEEYVYYYLQQLQKTGFSIAFISTSPLKESCITRLSQYAFLIIERENKCPDFGSWKVALSLLDWGKQLNAVLLVNDSVFGPFFNLGETISVMKEKYDVWGMTENYEIDYHLQSYFLYFNKRSIVSNLFSNFWKQVDLSATKDEVIQRYEVGLSTLFRKNNFKLGAYAGVDMLGQDEHLGQKHINPTLVFWKTLIEKYKFPFMKRELLIRLDIAKTYWTTNLYINTSGWRKTIGEHTTYPVIYIEQFLTGYGTFLKDDDQPVTLKKRKILFLCNNAENEEGQRLLINFLQWLKKETDIEAEILVCNKSNDEIENELTGLGIVTNLYSLTASGKQLLKQRLAEEIALIFSFTIENIATQKFLSILNVPQLVFVHEPGAVLKDHFSTDNTNWLLKNISMFLSATGAIRKNLVDVGIPAEKVELLYKFADFYDAVEFEKDYVTIKSVLGIPPDAFVVGMHTDVSSKQKSNLLPVIAAELCRVDNNIHIIWLGAAGSIQESAYADLAQAGLTERVHFAGDKVGRRSCFSILDIFILTSGDGTFPIINLENGLAGKPVICFTSNEGIDEYIDFGTGHTVPYMNIGKLSEKVLNYYNNRSLLKSEKDAIIKVVKENFTTAVQAPKIFQLINKYYDGAELMLKEEPVITFFTHIYYENSWAEIRNKLKNFDNNKNYFLFSISEACLVKDQIIEDIKKTFKKSYFLITSNIGKDIGGKMALIDIYLLLKICATYIVFVHDKQSPHSIQGETWKNGLFKIIDHNNQKLIINSFKNPEVGIIGSKDHIVNEYDAATGNFVNNSQLSKKLLLQFDMSFENYDFLGGTMYWIRAPIIEKFFKKNNPILMRENLEAGNVIDLYGERLAHTWERMFSWIATNEGFSIKGI